jgi:hypothetical protein
MPKPPTKPMIASQPAQLGSRTPATTASMVNSA